jgi:hypothetical protein
LLVPMLRSKVAGVASIAKPARHVEAGIGGDVAAVAAGPGLEVEVAAHAVTDKHSDTATL